MSDLPIADYAFVSDCHSAALVSREGSVDWLCFPRFDGPAVFARLLDERAGHWSIAPVERADVSRRYLPGTLVLETTYRTATGTARVVDTLAVGRNERGHELGADRTGALLRLVDGIDGEVAFACEYVPRPEYGLVAPLLVLHPDALLARGGASRLTMCSVTPFEIDGATARARFSVAAGERVGFALQHRASWEEPAPRWTQDDIASRVDDTAEAWRTWSDLHQAYDGPWRDLVHHSGRVLYGLTYFPTGAMCAAPTTSLPETPGGVRNWDYRYAWVRDASFTLQALWVSACPDEADKFFDYICVAAAAQVRDDTDLQIMFGLGGEHDLSERELPHLRGWRGSAPVRVGNDAWRQRQIDVYGELLDAAARLPDQIARLDSVNWDFLADLADVAAARWQEPDQGIWEIRGAPRHFLYSKLMCWVALDRAINMAASIGATDRVEKWIQVRDDVAKAILEQGWNDDVGAFTQAFGSGELDASVLMMPVVGFIDATDPRMTATIDAIARDLTDEHGLVYRYLSNDGLVGDEGTFLLCTFWLAQAQALAGRVDDARVTFERAIAFANDVGLLAEEVDARSGELLGNFPQALSHIGLVNAAWAIAQVTGDGSTTARSDSSSNDTR